MCTGRRQMMRYYEIINIISPSTINKLLFISLLCIYFRGSVTWSSDTRSADADYYSDYNMNKSRSVPETLIQTSRNAKNETSARERFARGLKDTLTEKWNKFRGKEEEDESMKNMWKKMKGKKTKAMQWDLSREEAAEVYQKYYTCLRKQYVQLKLLEKGKLKPVHAVMTLEGERVTLKCEVCTRPDRDKMAQQAVWQHLRRSDASLEPLLASNSRVKQTSQGSLIIHNLQLKDAGQYTCLDHAGEYVAIYQLDVKFRERRKMVKEGHALLNVTYLVDHNLKLMTTWTSWGSCDTCDFPGSRKRHGTCIVKKMNDADPIKPKDFPMLMLYPDGVPCHSTALPPRIRLLKEVRRRYEETLVRTCNQSCPTEAPPVVITDKDGNQVEVLPGGKFYSLNEKVPIPTMVQRRVVYEPEGKHLVLSCSDVEREKGVRWMRGKRRVDPLSIKRQTAGRVWMDSANRLHIGFLLLSDTAVYNCWELKRHVVALKVIVVDNFNEKLKLYITYGGFGITLAGTVVAFCCICVLGKGK